MGVFQGELLEKGTHPFQNELFSVYLIPKYPGSPNTSGPIRRLIGRNTTRKRNTTCLIKTLHFLFLTDIVIPFFWKSNKFTKIPLHLVNLLLHILLHYLSRKWFLTIHAPLSIGLYTQLMSLFLIVFSPPSSKNSFKS